MDFNMVMNLELPTYMSWHLGKKAHFYAVFWKISRIIKSPIESLLMQCSIFLCDHCEKWVSLLNIKYGTISKVSVKVKPYMCGNLMPIY